MADHEHEAASRSAFSWWKLWPLLGWGLFTVYLSVSGKMLYLLRPLYGYLALSGGVILLAVFLYAWILRVRANREKDAKDTSCAEPCPACNERRHGRKRRVGFYVRSLAFIIPLGIGLSLPDRGPNSLAATQWSAGDLAQAAQLAVAREQEKAEWEKGYQSLTVIGVAQRFRETQAQKVASTGLVAHPKQFPADQFLLVRFRMTCCAADAQPVAVPVQWAKAASLKENAWVTVFGKTDPQAKVLVADEVEPTKEPRNPYL